MRRLSTALLLLAACSDSSSAPPVPGTRIGPAGGTYAITSGPLAGASITIPAGALDRDVTIDITAATAEELDGLRRTGTPAVSFEPIGLELRLPATITLPNAVRPTSYAPAVQKVVARDGDGVIREAVVAPDGWQLGALATCWSVQYLHTQPFPVRDFMPLATDDWYQFDNDFVIWLADAAAVDRRFDGQGVTAWYGSYPPNPGPTLPTGPPTDDTRFVQIDADGAVHSFGQTMRAAFIRQSLFPVEPYVILPATVATLADGLVLHEADFTFTRNDQSLEEPGHVTVTLSPRGPLTVPAGTFPDVLPIEIRTDFNGSVATDRFWLAWRTGIVRYEYDFGLVGGGGLIQASVGGNDVPRTGAGR